MDIQRSEKPQSNQSDQDGNSGQAAGGGSQSGMFGPVLVIIGLIAIALVLVFAFNGGGNGMGSEQSEAVAAVGDSQIERAEFQEQLDALRSATSAQAQRFQQLSETRQQSLILSNLVDRELLLQAAQNAGVSVSDSEVDSQLQSRIEQIGGEEELQRRLDANNLTREEIRENLRNQLVINQYVSQNVSTTTDTEVEQQYNQLSDQQLQSFGQALSNAPNSTTTQGTPTLEQLRPFLQRRLAAQKQRQAQQQLLQQAREDINVEVMLDGVSYPPEAQSPQQGAQQQPPQQPQQPQQPSQQQQSSEDNGQSATQEEQADTSDEEETTEADDSETNTGTGTQSSS